MPGVVAVLAVGYAWVATGFRPFTLPALVATLGGGVAAIVVGRRLEPPVAAPEPIGGAWFWAVLGVALAAWELQAFLQHPRSAHPTVSSLTNDLLQSQAPRVGAMLAWLAVGIWLARR